jgi:hypothetical protein
VFHNAIRHRMREKDDYDRLYSIISEAIDGRDRTEIIYGTNKRER